MADRKLQFSTLLTLIGLIYLQTIWAEIDRYPEHDSGELAYEVIGTSAGSGSSSENGIEGSNYQQVGIIHSRRQRRSPHFGGHGHGVYQGHGHYRPVYAQHHRPYPYHHGGHGHHSGSNSHSQAHAQAISANFGGPHWNAGFSGAAASSGGGGGSNHIGYHHK